MNDNTPLSEKDTALVRHLKWLVTALTVTMIAGFIVLVTVVVMRFNTDTDTAPTAFPDTIALPEGVKAQAVTRGPDFLLVVGNAGRVFVFSPDGQTLRQEVEITR